MGFLIIIHNQAVSKTNSTDSLNLTFDSMYKHYQTKNIIISTSRFSEDITEVCESVSIIGSSYIENNFLRSTPELLNGIFGAWIQKTNHGGGSPFIRGLTGNQVLIMIDGFRLNNSITRYGPNQYFNTIDPLMLDKIEIVRGAGSVLYGSDAIGGTVQVFTKQPRLSQEFQINSTLIGRLMSGDMEKSGRAEFEISSRNFAMTAGLTLRDFGDIIGGGNIGRQTPSGYDEISGNTNFILKINEQGRIFGGYQITNQNGVPLYHKIKLENFSINHMDVQRRQLAYVKYDHTFTNLILSSSVAFHQSLENRIKQKNGSNDKDFESDKINTYALIFESHFKPLENITITSGIDIYYDYIGSEANRINTITLESKSKRGLYPDGSNNLNMAIFSHLKYTMNKFNVFGGLRFNYNKISLHEKDLGNVKIEPKAFVWSVGSLYKLSQNWSLSGNINTSFRSPNIDDLGTLGIVDFRYEIPNYALKPEHSLNYELGLRYNSHRSNLNITGFITKLDDLIIRVKSKFNGQDSINGYQVYNKVNSAKAELYGIESEANSHIFDWLMLSAHITYIYGQDLSKNEPMRRIPPLFGSIRSDVKIIENLYLALILDWAGKQSRLASGDKSDNRINPNGTPGWYSINIQSNYLYDFIKINFGIINLLDKDFRYHGSGIDYYGRTLWLGIKLNI